MLRAYETPIFGKSQKLTHSPAHVERHAGQETPLLYTLYLQWHHPGRRALLQLAQAPTQDYHSYITLYWVALRMKTRALAAHP